MSLTATSRVIRTGFAQNGDLRIYYSAVGSGPALVFAHGFTLDHRSWRKQVAHFSDRYTVVTYDSRGHGKSDSPITNYSRDHRETDLCAVVDHLEIGTMHLIGLSMGGATAIGFAVDYPERLRSLVLVSAGYTGMPSRTQDSLKELVRTHGVSAAKERWMRSTLRYFQDKPGYARDTLELMMSEHGGSPWLDPNRGQYAHRDDLALLGKMPAPTLVLAGEKDIHFVSVGEQLAKAAQNGCLEIVPGVGHMLNLESPDWFNDRLERWLNEVGQA